MTTYIGSAVGVTTCALPTHQAGDLLICNAFRDGSGSIPGLPAGWARITHGTLNSAAAHVFFRLATASGTTDPVSSNATSIVAHVYRPGTGKRLEIGAVAGDSATTGSLDYPALTMYDGSGASWVVAFGNHRSPDTASTTPPTGMVNRSNANNADDDSAGHDTNGPVSAWTQQTVVPGGTAAAWRTFVVEIREVAVGAGARFLQNASSGTDLTTYTFASQGVGDAADGDTIFFGVVARDTGVAAKTISSITLGGNAATIDIQCQNAAGTNSTIAAAARIAAPGSAADVVVTFSEAVLNCIVVMWRGNFGALHDSDFSLAGDPNVTLNIPAGGFALSIAATGASTAAIWTGLGPADFLLVETLQMSATQRTAIGALAALAILCNFGSPVESAGVFVSYTAEPQTVTPGIAAETDTALLAAVVPGVVSVQAGIAGETDTGLPVTLTGAATVVIGLASETDDALPAVTVPGAAALVAGIAEETDTGLASSAVAGTVVSVGIAAETDDALAATAIGGSVTVTAGIATEADTALPALAVGGAAAVATGTASELDTGLAASFTGATTVPAGIAAEADTAPAASALPGAVTVPAGIALEAGTALASTASGGAAVVVAGLPAETDAAPPAAVIITALVEPEIVRFTGSIARRVEVEGARRRVLTVRAALTRRLTASGER